MGESRKAQMGAIATFSYLRIRKNEEREVFHLDEAMSQEVSQKLLESPIAGIVD